MKTVFLNTSPKKRWSNSSYLLTTSQLFASGEKVRINFTGPKDYKELFSHLKTADSLVIAIPLYVDAIPSHVLILLQAIETFAKENHLNFKVYALCNCGFYEGQQCELELEIVECWCKRAGLTFAGGTGIGAGEMIGALRLNIPIAAIIALIEFLIGIIVMLISGNFSVAGLTHYLDPIGIIITLLVMVVFSIDPWLTAISLGKSASQCKEHGIRFSTVSFCPAFLFVFFASIFWVLRAFIMHLVPSWKLFRRISQE